MWHIRARRNKEEGTTSLWRSLDDPRVSAMTSVSPNIHIKKDYSAYRHGERRSCQQDAVNQGEACSACPKEQGRPHEIEGELGKVEVESHLKRVVVVFERGGVKRLDGDVGGVAHRKIEHCPNEGEDGARRLTGRTAEGVVPVRDGYIRRLRATHEAQSEREP